jgi:hypothetical protein
MFDTSDARRPCGDDMCTGLLADDDRCGTCGRITHDAVPNEIALAVGVESPAACDERVLCGDEMCTGLIGEDARCGTCGRAG